MQGFIMMSAGLANMLNTGASVQGFSCTPAADSAAVRASVSVRGCGTLLLYATSAPSSCTVNGTSVQAEYLAEQCTLKLPVSRSGDSMQSTVELLFAL